MAKFELEVKREMDTQVARNVIWSLASCWSNVLQRNMRRTRIASPRGSIGPKALFLHIVHFAGISVRTNLLYSCYGSCIIASLAGNATRGQLIQLDAKVAV